MKNIKPIYIILTVILMIQSCNQEVKDLEDPIVPVDTSCDDAKSGDAYFTKFVAIGSSYTAGFQAGALFNAGQQTSLGAILAEQFACAGGGAFNQPDIKSEYGYNIFVQPNPPDDNQIRGRFLLQGTPPGPSPYKFTLGDLTAAPNPIANPGFMYTGASTSVPTNQLNNFSVQAIVLGQALIPQTGDWSLAGTSDKRFNPFYARFASDGGAGGTTLLADAVSSLSNGGTFFLFWLGMDDVLLHAVFGGDESQAPLTTLDPVSESEPGFKYLYNTAIGSILLNTTLKGVVSNYPDIFSLPHFTSIPWNALPLTAADTTQLNPAYAAYNNGLKAAVSGSFIDQNEADKRKIHFAVGQNGIVIEDETLTDLSGLGLPSIRQTTNGDLIPLSTGGILGVEDTPDDPSTKWGITKPLPDRYALLETEISEINDRLDDFNAHIKSVAESNSTKIAFADVNKLMKEFKMTGAYVLNGVTITPSIAPPTGIYSEDGLHPNSRGYAFIANIFIDAINAKFNSTIPHADLSKYKGTALPINP